MYLEIGEGKEREEMVVCLDPFFCLGRFFHPTSSGA